MTLNDFIKQHSIDKIVNAYSDIADKVLDETPEDRWIWMREEYGDGENCRTRALEIWAIDQDAKQHQIIFNHLINDIEKIPNCVQVYVVYIEPGSTVPQHIDDNEGFFLITAVNEIEGNWLKIADKTINFKKGQSVGIKPDIEYHGGENFSEKHWIFLIVVLSPHPFEDKTFVYE